MARQSVYPSNALDLLSHLDDCVNFTEAAAASLQASLGRFEPGIRDLPRLSKILSNNHHFLVLPTTQVQSHQAAVSTSLAPQIENLIAKAEGAVASQVRKVAILEERLAIVQSARAVPTMVVQPDLPEAGDQEDEEGTEEENGEEGDGWGGKSKLDGLEMRELTIAQRRKVIMLKGKRERLERERKELMDRQNEGDGEDEGA
ncbi:uncharacterized protein MKK02DRAFT_37697 [Dioszegia hungarica]|uniref:DASH complex subunit SPC19 n=1 Tax=Dioszegia hungarica TaxID=4972 RepID=A0AA38H6N0_9TREE|nr:uncharacterized protein MKK02DRAFT_37697 [Dioszegia hungarica]KAI9634822.1 hypothetical protein MKK02DRAFT_37697 [Dioszegia hungarica]